MKRLTHKQLEESGWAQFVSWAVQNNLKPDDILTHKVEVAWRTKTSTERILKTLEHDVFSGRTRKPMKMVGLSKQLTGKQ